MCTKQRKNINTTLDTELYSNIKMLAALLPDKNANDLIEDGMQYILDKYNFSRPEININSNKK